MYSKFRGAMFVAGVSLLALAAYRLLHLHSPESVRTLGVAGVLGPAVIGGLLLRAAGLGRAANRKARQLDAS